MNMDPGFGCPVAASVVAALVLILGVWAAYVAADGHVAGLACFLAAAVVGALLAAALWPGVVLVGILMFPMVIRRIRREVRDRRATRPLALSDEEKFRRMAREQRNLARQARADGNESLARLQDELAAQYDQTAAIYVKDRADEK